MAEKKKYIRKTGYWKSYYHRVKKFKVQEGRPVKDCQGCGKPIINPNKYKQNVHLIPGERSDCQKKRDSDYKKSLPKASKQRKRDNIKKPKGLSDRFNVIEKRMCLKCNEIFISQSLHNRTCERCKLQQPDIMNFSSMALETQNIEELFEFAWNY